MFSVDRGTTWQPVENDPNTVILVALHEGGAYVFLEDRRSPMQRFDNLGRLTGTHPPTPHLQLGPFATAFGAGGSIGPRDREAAGDRVGNPLEIRDWRTASEWLGAPAPVTRKMQYDDLYRLRRIDYQYPSGADPWLDPYAAELADPTRAQPAPRTRPSTGLRPQQQSWKYDWLGNTLESDDDAHSFYERSLGAIQNNGYQLTQAQGAAGNLLEASCDRAGNLTGLVVQRTGECIPVGAECHAQVYEYEWDEVGRLVKAKRIDGTQKGAHLEFAYDASDSRVRKTVIAPDEESRHNLYIFNTLEVRLAEYVGGDYTVDEATEVPYLFAHGVRLARVVHTAAPEFTSPSLHVYLELGDHLGTTTVVLDRQTGELVERSTAYAYGGVESEYRPGRWEGFREEHRFTGKEDDIEVGLTYFGKRYLNSLLNRWISPDPLGVHAPGKGDLNLYAYVRGKVLSAVDPVGLDPTVQVTEHFITVTLSLVVKNATPDSVFDLGAGADLQSYRS